MGGSIQLLICRIDFLDVMRTVESDGLDDIGQWGRKNGTRCLYFHDNPLILISDLLTGFKELDLGYTGVFSSINTLP